MAVQETKEATRLWSMIRKVRVAMMTTEDGGMLRARPMIAVDRDFDGTLWFFTRASSHKVAEIGADQRVSLAYAEPSSQDYVSISGRASLVRDPAEVASHWVESARVWFPKGKSDPDIALLRVEVEQGEFWDAPSSAMLHAYGYVKAVVTGQSPNPGGHATVGKADIAHVSTGM